MPSSTRRAFTLVELLVVIGIIAVLIGILLPSLLRARVAAMKTQDLSNCRQIVTAAVNYATNAKGVYPFGMRSNVGAVDDMAWTYSDTYDYFLQFTTTRTTTAAMAAVDSALRKVLSCNAIAGSLPNKNLFVTTYYGAPTIAVPDSTVKQMQMGWIYWGNRPWDAYVSPTPGNPAPTLVPATSAIVDATGNPTGEVYQMPNRQGQHATTRTLVTCYCYNYASVVPASLAVAYLPHRAHGSYSSISVPASNAWGTLRAAMDGMCVGYTDGSARFVPPGNLGAIQMSSGNLYFYDATAR